MRTEIGTIDASSDYPLVLRLEYDTEDQRVYAVDIEGNEDEHALQDGKQFVSFREAVKIVKKSYSQAIWDLCLSGAAENGL